MIIVIIPALNEEKSIADVVSNVLPLIDQVIVVDNGSTDKTAVRAESAGARVISEPLPGYGRACLAGVRETSHDDIIVFMDGDGADDPSDLNSILAPIINKEVDFVIGSRLIGQIDRDALTLQQRYGNNLACFLMKVIWKGRFTDLGPFRAIRRVSYDKLNMQNKTYGWTVEMQVRALREKISYTEIPVHYRKRVGVSKISGTFKGVTLAGYHILSVICREGIKHLRQNQQSAETVDQVNTTKS